MCVSTGLLDRFDADWDLRLCVVRFEQSRQPRAQGKFTCRLVELSKWTNVMSRTAALRWALSTLGGTSHRYVYAHQRAQYAHTPRRAKPVCPLAFQRSMCASSTAIGAASEIDALPSNWKGDLRSIGLAVFQRYAPKTNKNKKYMRWKNNTRAGSTKFPQCIPMQSDIFNCPVPSASERGREMIWTATAHLSISSSPAIGNTGITRSAISQLELLRPGLLSPVRGALFQFLAAPWPDNFSLGFVSVCVCLGGGTSGVVAIAIWRTYY